MSAIIAASPVVVIPPTLGGMSPHVANALRTCYDFEMSGRVRCGFHIQTFDEWILDIIAQLRGQHGEEPGAAADWLGRSQ